MQLNFMDQLFPEAKIVLQKKYDLEERKRLYEEWLQTAPREEKMIFQTFRGSWVYLTRFEKGLKEITKIAKTLKYHYGNMSKDNYIYSFKFDDLDYKLVFQMGEEIIFLETRFKNVFEEQIRFPAMCMSYYNLQGNKIDFRIRDNFILEKLGYKNARKCEWSTNEKKDFSNTEWTLTEIIEYLDGRLV